MRAVETSAAPAAIGPYTQAVVDGGFVFVSGQIGLDPATGEIVPGGAGAETRQVLANLRAILEAAGAALRDVVKTTVYLADLADFPELNRVYAAHFTEPFPARATVQAVALPKGARVEIEAIARMPR